MQYLTRALHETDARHPPSPLGIASLTRGRHHCHHCNDWLDSQLESCFLSVTTFP